MKKTRLFVIDDNESSVGLVKEYFKKIPDIDVSITAKDGSEGIILLERKQEEFDMILLDLVMPRKDGIKVLEYIQDKNIEKKVIVLTSYNAQDTIRKVSSLGASYYMLKPYKFSDLEMVIRELSKQEFEGGEFINLYHNNLQVSITKTLHKLGVPSHIKGYQYIQEGIMMVYRNPNIRTGITKKLYPTIADKYNSTTIRVERAIRHAIEVSWNRGDWELMEDIFGHSIDIEKAKPTNSEYIITIADKIRLEYRKPFTNN